MLVQCQLVLFIALPPLQNEAGVAAVLLAICCTC